MLITSLSLFSFSDKESEIWFPHLDKIVHFTFYLVLVLLGAFSFREVIKRPSLVKNQGMILFGFSLVYGMLIELLQHIMPYNRSAEVWDMLANFAGALTGTLLIQRYSSLIDRLK